jgi:hypothetical protein
LHIHFTHTRSGVSASPVHPVARHIPCIHVHSTFTRGSRSGTCSRSRSRALAASQTVAYGFIADTARAVGAFATARFTISFLAIKFVGGFGGHARTIFC